MMLNCTGFTDDKDLPDAARHFRMFTSEPIKSGGTTVELVQLVPLTNVLDLMKYLSSSNVNQVLLACHATFDKGLVTGLRIPLLSGAADVFLEKDGLTLLGPGNHGGVQELDIAKQLGVKVTDLKVMQDAADSMRKKKGIDRIVIRGCEVGMSNDLLGSLKRMFGCRYICAPTKPLFFGSLSIDVPAGAVDKEKRDKWFSNHPTAILEEGFAWEVRQPLQNSLNIEAWSDSSDATARWVEKHFGKGKFSPGQKLFWEAIRANRPVFPRDPDYRDYLQALAN